MPSLVFPWRLRRLIVAIIALVVLMVSFDVHTNSSMVPDESALEMSHAHEGGDEAAVGCPIRAPTTITIRKWCLRPVSFLSVRRSSTAVHWISQAASTFQTSSIVLRKPLRADALSAKGHGAPRAFSIRSVPTR
ncbi:MULTISPECIES: hypothetical protein [unclassified Mesorhizobium]|uniref:hypothetical protein n=1 Tax=unclassified Mesorhizobium TaxID=325217 RepID=UPI003335022A